jgi:Tol biopolymer transport system component
MTTRLTATLLFLLLGLPARSVVAQAAAPAAETPIYVDGWDYDNAKTGWNIYVVSLTGATKVLAGTAASERYPFRIPGERAVGFLLEDKGSSRVLKRDLDTEAQADLGVTTKRSTICDMAPDGKQLVCPDETGDTRQVFIFDLATKQKRQITQSTSRNNCLDPSWSPDGRSIAYFTGPNADQIGGEAKPKGDHLVIYDVESGKSRLLTKAPKGTDQTPVWSPDGKWIAFHHQTKDYGWDIWIVRPDGTSETQLTSNKEEETYPSWSPDGKQIAFQCYQRKPDAFDLCVVDVESKQVRQVTNTPKLDERHPVWGR